VSAPAALVETVLSPLTPLTPLTGSQWRIFWGFCINQFGVGSLHYDLSRSDFGFNFAEIFVIEKRLSDSLSQGVDKIAYS
jgi:hypothetical protein